MFIVPNSKEVKIDAKTNTPKQGMSTSLAVVYWNLVP